MLGADFWTANKEKGIGEVGLRLRRPSTPTGFRERTVEKESCHREGTWSPAVDTWTAPLPRAAVQSWGGCTRGSGEAASMGGLGRAHWGSQRGRGRTLSLPVVPFPDLPPSAPCSAPPVDTC